MKNFFVFLCAFVFIIWYFPIAFPHGQPTVGHSIVPDAEADYLVTLRTFQGQGLYSSFSIVYPPGRFFLQSLLFHFFTPSFAVMSVFHIAIVLVFFPAVLFLLTYFMFQALLQNHLPKKLQRFTYILSLLLAFLTSFLNLIFIRSAQETHIITALFFILLLSVKKMNFFTIFMAGVLFGLTFLFRIDSGILLSLALFVAALPQFYYNRVSFVNMTKIFVTGLSFVWIPTLLRIFLHGSLLNFFYDTFVLGLLVQPKIMSLPIPENELGLVFLAGLIFLVSSATTLFFDSKTITPTITRFALKAFAVLAVLSFISALGRSDEPHLWYGLVWASPLVIYTGYRALSFFLKKDWPSIKTIVLMSAFFYVFSWTMIQMKSPKFFLPSVVLLFSIFHIKSFKIFPTLVAGVFTTLLVFHSVTFLKLKMFIPGQPTRLAFEYDWITSENDELGGLKMVPESAAFLNTIRGDIPLDQKYLFIFPKNLLLNEYFRLQNPSRYVLLSLERSAHTEREVIRDLESTNTQYFLTFTKEAEEIGGPIWEWILKNSIPIQSYQLVNDEAILRKKTATTDSHACSETTLSF